MPCLRWLLVDAHVLPAPLKPRKSRQIVAKEDAGSDASAQVNVKRWLAFLHSYGTISVGARCDVVIHEGWLAQWNSGSKYYDKMVRQKLHGAYSDDSRIFMGGRERVVVHPVPAFYQ